MIAGQEVKIVMNLYLYAHHCQIVLRYALRSMMALVAGCTSREPVARGIQPLVFCPFLKASMKSP
jgi:hypothetical protein